MDASRHFCDVHDCPDDATNSIEREDDTAYFCAKHYAMMNPKHGDVIEGDARDYMFIAEDPIHPLLNPKSKHYQMVDGVEAIERMEQMYTTPELMVWANITAMKYRLRIGNKGDVLEDAVKIAGYEAYYTYLSKKL